MTAFEYAPRPQCICQAELAGARGRVTRQYGWGAVTFLRCERCGSWCQSPLLTAAALSSWVDSDDYQGSAAKAGAAYAHYLADERNRLEEARGRAQRDLEPLLPARANVLEIGCGTASLLAALRERGHDVTGVDLSPRFARFARDTYGIEVVAGDVLDIALPDGRFDAVLLMGTISNLRDLAACLARIRELLRPGGVLVFNFPDAASAWVKLVYRSRFWMYAPSVCTFMTSDGCRRALDSAGFRRLTIRSDVQRPSVQKLLKHARAGFLLRAADALGLGGAAMPFAFPVPTVRFAVAHT